MKKLFVCVIIILVACFGLMLFKLDVLENTVFSNTSVVSIEVVKGDSLLKVNQRLLPFADFDKISFKLWIRLNPEYTNIQTGFYEIAPDSNLISVFSMFMNGDTKQHRITLLEGHTALQWFSQLSKNPNIVDDILSESAIYLQLISKNSNFCENEFKKLEGCLLPDTYFFDKGTTSSQIIERAFNAMQVEIADAWGDRFSDIPIKSPYQALILASIIEKETALDSERKKIAGVFVNRLKQKMRLQTDPTVIYGLGDKYKGDITRKHLRTPTPYNTRIIKGLPPTPIAMPNQASINAALQPAATDALYFVANGSGGHKFSTNLADHNKAVRAYLQKLQE